MTPDAQGRLAARALEPLVPPRESDDLSSHGHRQLIGWLGLALPVLLWVIAGLRPTEGLEPWALLASVSAYYFTGAVAAFVGVLVALSVFLFTYRGYDNASHRWDRLAAIVAGSAAVLVAFFPTEAPPGVKAPLWWSPRSDTIHAAAATCLFGAFIVFSLFLFPKSGRPAGAPVRAAKRVRNGIYILCGVAMLACVAWVWVAKTRGAPIFWPESLALGFFAVSWLAKGRAHQTAATAAARVLHYGRHPVRMLASLRSSVRG